MDTEIYGLRRWFVFRTAGMVSTDVNYLESVGQGGDLVVDDEGSGLLRGE